MINKNAIETMSQMLALIKKYAKSAYPDVETEASRESRHRAWMITSMLARLAEHAAASDLCYLLAENVSKTNSERQGYLANARYEDGEFMNEVRDFLIAAEDFESRPVKGSKRTDDDIVRKIERDLKSRESLQSMRLDMANQAKAKKSKREAAEVATVTLEDRLAEVEARLETSRNLALERGLVVSLNKYRTVIKRVGAVVPSAEKATPAKKMKLVRGSSSPKPGAAKATQTATAAG
jgi:hypothetical protein